VTTIPEIVELKKRLLSCRNRTMKNIVAEKSDRALSDLRRAQAYIDKAFATLVWAEAQFSQSPQASSPAVTEAAQ
jgi:hypothetical protein